MTSKVNRVTAIEPFASIRIRAGIQTVIKKPCARPGCSVLVIRGYCPAHQQQRDSSRWEALDRWRGSSRERGYDRNWERFRKWYLARHPACYDCGRLATEVHHKLKVKDHPELKLVEANCMALCKTCHTKRTARGE
jgi:5-methylcytosine-specific restriction protein A